MTKLPNNVPLPPIRKRIIDPDAADRFVASAAEPEAVVIPKSVPTPPPEPTKRLTLDLPVSLHRKFKKKAIDNEITMMKFLIDAVDQWTREDG